MPLPEREVMNRACCAYAISARLGHMILHCRFSLIVVASVLAGMTSLAACGSELDGAGGLESGDEPVAEESSALNLAYNSQLYTWVQGTIGPVKMKDTANWFCSLTRVTGAFRGGGEQIRVFANSAGFWYLTRASQ